MSEKKEKAQMGLVERVMAVLGLADSGKVAKFIEREKKECKRALEKLATNKKNVTTNYNSDLQDLNDALEDAEEALEDVKTQITPEDVTNNASMNEFSDIYWGRIDDARKDIATIETMKEVMKHNHNSELKDIDEQIEAYKYRLSVLEEKK